ncbi:MAG TPA: hypothetical protein VMC06_00870, partial [Opitutaceae bacterium]|nr:hypothetical protein [Opitutaceae bacterium]
MRFFLVFLAFVPALLARPFTVAAYNVENLFDVDGIAVYDEYQPSAYTPAHLRTKLDHIAQVVARIGDAGRGPDIILFDEIEVDRTPASRVYDPAAFLRLYASTTFEKMLTAPLTPEEAGLPAEAWLLKAFADRGLTGYTVVAGSDSPATNYEDG